MQNAGRGPALHIRMHLEPGGISPEDWSLGALAAGDNRDLLFRTAQPTGLFQFLVDYRDLAGRAHSTVMIAENMRFNDVRVFEDHHVTVLGDAIYPQPGLRDVSPKARPGWRARVSGAVQSMLGHSRDK